MSELIQFDRSRTCCITGHRSKDLPFKGDLNSTGMRNLISTIYLAISEISREGCDTFISGMADGTDLICAEIISQMIDDGAKLRLICVVPYAGQIKEHRRPRNAYIYKALTTHFPTVVLSREYFPQCYKNRNMFMVRHSSRLLGVYKPKIKGSGTLQTIRLAEKAGLNCRIIRLDKDSAFRQP